MLVVDASAVLLALGVDTSAGERARSALVAGGPLHAPRLLDLEVLSGLRGLVAGRKMTPRRAAQVRDDYWDLAITRHPHRSLSDRVWDLRHNLTVDDAAYVALAEAVPAPLLTADAALARTPGLRCSVEVVTKR